MALNNLPEWIGTGLLGAVIAAMGFVGKLLYELWSDRRNAQAARLARIIDLSALFTASRVLFLVQNRWARSLLELLRKNHPEKSDNADGFESVFTSLHDAFSTEEAALLIELHAHLLLWRCKYDAWIPTDSKHALVYLADEAAHGVGFPQGLDELIRDVMTELKKSAPALPVVTENTQGGQ